MVTATFRFYEELNDFLPPALRQREFERACARAATVKHMMEALGVPHTEVELILINGESSGFDQIPREGDRVASYFANDELLRWATRCPHVKRHHVAFAAMAENQVLVRAREEPLRLADSPLPRSLSHPID